MDKGLNFKILKHVNQDTLAQHPKIKNKDTVAQEKNLKSKARSVKASLISHQGWTEVSILTVFSQFFPDFESSTPPHSGSDSDFHKMLFRLISAYY